MSLDKDQIHKELDLIQGVINRMAANSFEVKKWLLAILSAIIVFNKNELMGGNLHLVWMLLLPVICFWYLDAFFLGRERFFREVYKWAITHRKHTELFLYDLNTELRHYGTSTENLNKPNQHWWKAMRSGTLLPFYLVPVFFVLLYAGYGIYNLLHPAVKQACCCCS